MKRMLSLLICLSLSGLVVWATAPPPQLVNYQGVLRDSAGKPLTGTYDMIFKFYDAPTGGTLLLTDEHTASGGAAVSVSNGLFNVQLGGGVVVAGTETFLPGVFGNQNTVYLSVQVGSETLSPRTRLISGAWAVSSQYAQSASAASNSDQLDGQHASAFAAASHNQDASTITTGTLAVARGGTGLASPGTSGNLLQSNGSAWVSATPGFLTAESDGVIGNEVVGAANSTLTRFGTGTAPSPYQLGLNLGNANSWTGAQTFTNVTNFAGSGIWEASGHVGVGTASPSGMLEVATTGERLDQICAQRDTSSAANGQWQSFTAGRTGTLTKVLTVFGATGSRTGTLTLYAGQGTGGTVLASAPFTYTPSSQWFTVTFSSPPSVTSGSVYTLGVSQPAGGMLWECSSTDAYADGISSMGSSKDFVFQEFVNGLGSSFTVTGNGKVGVGTSSPVAAFTLDAEDGTARIISRTGAYGGALELQSSNLDGHAGALRFLNASGNEVGRVSSGSNGYFAIYNTGGAGYPRISIVPDGQVGVNTLSAQYTLDVSGDLHASGKYVDSSSSAGTSGQVLQSTGTGTSWVNQSSLNAGWIVNGSNEYASVSGNVGIGTTTPDFPLDISAGQAVVRMETTSSGNGAVLVMNNLTASRTYLGAINFNDGVGQIGYLANNDITFRTNGGERVRMGGGGGSAYNLQVMADSAAKPSTNTWTVASDRRLKKDIAPFTDGLAVLEKINPITYRYNGLAGMPTDASGIGVVAQEIREVAPYTVGTFKAKLREGDEAATDLYDFNSHALTFVLINAVKELDERTKGLVPPAEAGRPPAQGSTGEGASYADSGLRLMMAESAARAGAAEVFQDESGNVYGRSFRPSLPEVATLMPASDAIETGDVLVADDLLPGHVRLASVAIDPRVLGVATGEPGVCLNGRGPAQDALAEPAPAARVPVALSGIVLCKVDAAAGPIAVGDLLVTSTTPGYAMRAADPKPGTVVGKALEPLASGTGLIKVLVMLR